MVVSTLWKETHPYSLECLHETWRSLRDLPNRQIKMTANYIVVIQHT